MYKGILNFVSIVSKANKRNQRDVRLTIDEANRLHEEISKLLIEIKSNNETEKTYDGGKF